MKFKVVYFLAIFSILASSGCSMGPLKDIGRNGIPNDRLYAKFQGSNLNSNNYGFSDFCILDRDFENKLKSIKARSYSEYKESSKLLCNKRELKKAENGYIKLSNLSQAYKPRCSTNHRCHQSNKFFDKPSKALQILFTSKVHDQDEFNYGRFNEALQKSSIQGHSYLRQKNNELLKEFKTAEDRVLKNINDHSKLHQKMLVREKQESKERQEAKIRQDTKYKNEAKKLFTKLSNNLQIGHKICSIDNKAGYLERLENSKAQIRLARRSLHEDQYMFFYNKSIKYESVEDNRIIWEDASSWATCDF